jgi:hypothetical protein
MALDATAPLGGTIRVRGGAADYLSCLAARAQVRS